MFVNGVTYCFTFKLHMLPKLYAFFLVMMFVSLSGEF